MNENGTVAAGLDTHRDTHALCVIDRVGRVLRTGTYSADAAGYGEIASAIGEPGDCAVVGIEGTGSYGAGVARRLAELGYDVAEVVRPRREKRMAGRDKNDPADAERAARDALVVTAPAPVRERLAGMRTPTLMKELSRRRRARGELERSLWDSLRSLAPAWRAAKEAAAEQEAAMRSILEANAPALLDVSGCGAISAARLAMAAGGNPERVSGEAAFASLCGASPIEASSGKVKRCRLNRGGDRQANRALHAIARQRMRRDDRTKAYVEKRAKEGKSRRETERVLVRYIAREVYRAIMHPMSASRASSEGAARSARAARVRMGVAQSQAASALGVASARISGLERCVLIDETLLQRYRGWLESIASDGRWKSIESTLDSK